MKVPWLLLPMGLCLVFIAGCVGLMYQHELGMAWQELDNWFYYWLEVMP